MANSFPTRLGNFLRRHRQTQQRRQVDVARAIGVSQPVYSAYETGRVVPSLTVLAAIIEELGIDPQELLAILEPDDDGEPNGVAA